MHPYHKTRKGIKYSLVRVTNKQKAHKMAEDIRKECGEIKSCAVVVKGTTGRKVSYGVYERE